MKTKLLCVAFLFGFFRIHAQDPIKKFIEFESKFDSLKRELNGTKAAVSFGISGNSSNSLDYHKINSSTSLNYGAFPYKFKLDLKTETEIKNGKTNDKISDLFISYDYYPDTCRFNFYKSGNRYKRKIFVFVSRYSDSYLGIDEKYELGAGTVINFAKVRADKVLLTEAGIQNKKKITHLRDTLDIKYINYGVHKPDEVDELKQANILRYQIIRPALLFGIFYEVEKMAYIDSIPTDSVPVAYPANFAATNQLMFEVRPTLEFNFTDNLSLSLKCYFKIPFKQLFGNNIVNMGDTAHSKFDCFIDFPMALSYKVNKSMIFSLQYRFMYDNAPQRKFIQLYDTRKYLIRPDQRHHAFDFMLTVNF
jgi:hypothetical protein